jgi:hypothetical protein
MHIATALNIVGLVIGVVAASLMYYFPPRVLQYTENGEPIMVWSSNKIPEKVGIGKWQLKLTRIGPILLGLAFIFQIAGTCFSESIN